MAVQWISNLYATAWRNPLKCSPRRRWWTFNLKFRMATARAQLFVRDLICVLLPSECDSFVRIDVNIRISDDEDILCVMRVHNSLELIRNESVTQTKGFGRQNRQKMSLGHLFLSDELIPLWLTTSRYSTWKWSPCTTLISRLRYRHTQKRWKF